MQFAKKIVSKKYSYEKKGLHTKKGVSKEMGA
jgi:hypothetical protein